MAHTPEEKYIEAIKPQVKGVHCQCIFLLLLTVPVLYFGLSDSLKPSDEQPDVWFQRCGSILVALGAIVEFKLLSINGVVNPSGVAGKEHLKISEKFKKIHNPLTVSSFIVIFVGTIIWGYGDVLFKIT